MYHFFIVAAGGALGAGMRHLVNLAALRAFGPNFPWGTMIANITGGLAMGLFAELLARRLGGSTEWRLFVATGMLGGFTTFSAFTLDAFVLYERQAFLQAAGYVGASVALSIGALVFGMWVARTLW